MASLDDLQKLSDTELEKLSLYEKNERLIEVCINGDLDTVKRLVVAKADVNCKDSINQTPLSLAAFYNRLSVVQYLVSNGADVNYNDPVWEAVYNNNLEVVRVMINAGAKSTNKILHKAVERSGPGIVQILINAGAEVTDEHLRSAVERRGSDIVQILINAGAEVTEEHLTTAVECCGFDIVQTLIETGANVTGEHLRIAKERGRPDIVQTLINSCTKVTEEHLKVLEEYSSPAQSIINTVSKEVQLMIAVKYSRPDLVQILINTGAKATEEHLMSAVRYSTSDIVHTLINAGAKVTDGHLKTAIKYSTCDILKTIIHTGVKVSDIHLMIAVENSRPSTVMICINAGVKVTEEHLMSAVRYSTSDIVRTLINAGANVTNDHLNTAAAYGTIENVQTLINTGAPVTEEHLMSAVIYNTSYMVQTLINAGANVTEEHLKTAAECSTPATVQTLINAGAKVTKEHLKTAEEYNTLDTVHTLVKAEAKVREENLKVAAKNSSPDIVQTLIRDGANVTEEHLMIAVKYSRPAIVMTLINAGVKVTEEHLMIAVECSTPDIVETLINTGTKVTEKHLRKAAEYGILEIVQILIKSGAKVSEEHLLIAVESNNPAIVMTFINAGAKVTEKHLMSAVRCNTCDIVQTLIYNGANVTEEHLKIAARYSTPNIVQTLINAKANVTEDHLMTALECNTLGIVQVLLNNGAKVTDEAIKHNAKRISNIISGEDYTYQKIAETYKIHQLLTNKRAHEVIENMEFDKATIQQKPELDYKNSKQELLERYNDAIKHYKDEMQYQIAGVTLTEAEQTQLGEIFAAGTEKDYFVRINFVGFTGAGKTSIMLQMFLQRFETSKITSTDGIDICLGYCIIDLATGKWKKYNRKENDELLERIKAMTMVMEYHTSNNENSGPQSILSRTTQSNAEQKKIGKSGAKGGLFNESVQQHSEAKTNEESNSEPQNILLGTTKSNPEQKNITTSGTKESDQPRTSIKADLRPYGDLTGAEIIYDRCSSSQTKTLSGIFVNQYLNTSILQEENQGKGDATVESFNRSDQQHIGTKVDKEPKPEQENSRNNGVTGGMLDESDQQHSVMKVDEEGTWDGTEDFLYDRHVCKQTKSHPEQVVDQHLNVRIQQATARSGRNKTTASVRGFDYAGQATYYSLHQLFFSKRGINLIVLDASRDFDDPINDEDVRHIGGHLTGNSKDFFRYWSKLLRYFLPRSKTAKIITVFTHKDLVQNEDQLQDKKFVIQNIVEEMGMTEMFYKGIFCVNANDPEDTDLHRLRNVILKLSQKASDWGQRMPSRWLLLEDKLMTKKSEGIRVMTLTEVEELNERSSLRLESRDELLLFLKVHHDIGTLIHFPDQVLQNIVILDVQWLVDCFKTIIKAKQFRDKKHRKQWKRLHQEGIVETEFIQTVWKDHEKERFFEFRDELILLMNTMDLISSPRKYNNEGYHLLNPYYVVPCMLQKAPEDFLMKCQRNADNSNNALSFEFEYSFLPTVTVYRLLATCIAEYGDSHKSKATVYCNAALFKVYKGHYLTLEITNSSIIANILVFGRRSVEVGVSQGVREFLDDTLKCIIDAQKTTTKYEMSVACGKENTSWLKWKDLMENSTLVCDHFVNDPPHVVNSHEIIKQWLVKKVVRTESQISRRELHEDKKPTHIQLGRISRRIPNKDKFLLFTELGLKEDDVNNVDEHKPVTLLLLLEWLRKPNATLNTLASALSEQQGYTLVIEEVQNLSYDWRADFTSDRLNKKVSDATESEIDVVCLMTGAKYLELGLELGFRKEAIDAFEMDHKYCHKITRQIIKSWTKKAKKLATWEVLGDALYEIKADPQFIKDMDNSSKVSNEKCTIA